QLVKVTSRVDDDRLQGFVAPDDGAVLLEGGDRNGEVAQHGAAIIASQPGRQGRVRAGCQARTLAWVPTLPLEASGRLAGMDCSSASAPAACTSMAFFMTSIWACWVVCACCI